jgi:hypothetical protein
MNMEKLPPGYDVDFKAERARLSPLTRMLMSGEMNNYEPKPLTSMQRFDRW